MANATPAPPSANTPTPSPVAGTPTPSAIPGTPTPAASPDRLWDYEKLLADRSTQFELFLQNLCTILATFLAGLVAFLGVAMAIYNRRDVATVKNDIRAEYRKEIGNDLQKAKLDLATDFRKEAKDEITRIRSDLEPTLKEMERGMSKQIDAAVKAGTDDLRTRLDVLNTKITQPLFYTVVEYASVISQASAILFRESTNDPKIKEERYRERSEVIDRFKKLQDRVLHHRTFNILFGRLYKAQRDYPGAIAALTKAIDSRTPADLPDGEKVDYAALIFNRACYLNLLSKENLLQNNPDLAEANASRAWNDLKIWAKLAPDEREGTGDEDLAGLLGRPPRTSWDLLWSEVPALSPTTNRA